MKSLSIAFAVCLASLSGSALANPIEYGKRLCTEQGPARLAWKDPESLRVGSATGGTMTTFKIGNTSVGARLFFVDVNAKNSYGAYAGARSLHCYTSEDGRRILEIRG